jgi:hypothetical protein
VRLAYLITAYNDPEQFTRLVTALSQSESRIFVHIDGNVDITPFIVGAAGLANITFVEQRFRVEWMGFSQVQSILSLMQEAYAEKFDYYVLLSGSDYPIKDSNYIHDFFSQGDSEYLCFWQLRDRPSWLHKIGYYYPIDQIPIHGYSKEYEKNYLIRLFWGKFYQWRERFPARRYLDELVPFGGSDWWSLSHQAVSYSLAYVCSHPKYSRFYRFTHCPSEMYFHTIILNSPLANRVQNYELYSKWSADLSGQENVAEPTMIPEQSFHFRYYDWSPDREGPSILDDRDKEALSSSNALFARKFISGRSTPILDYIDTEILGIA